jgi:outer membrane receptor protein involved in Fe transport
LQKSYQMPKLVTLFLFLSSSILYSQIQITGKLANQNKQPINLAEVQLINKDSVAVKNEFTNEEGVFSLSSEKGEYVLKIIQIGKIIHNQKFIVSQNLNLGVLQITENPQQLNEVVVTARKKLIERKIDRLVFNVENSISATGGDALDALKITPSIQVQNDQIAMIGKSKMSVMVDDRVIQLFGNDLINYLKTISSDNIKSIEVITTPPAKYDAEGNSGIVNIKLKKAKKDSWSTTLRSTNTLATYFRQSEGANFMFQKNKWSVLADVSVGTPKYIYTNDQTYHFPNDEYWEANIHHINKYKYISPSLSVDYQINKKWTVGLQYSGSFDRENRDEFYNTSIFQTNTKADLLKFYKTNGKNKEDAYTHSLNFKTLHVLDTIGKKITLDVDYFKNYSNKNNPFYTTNSDYDLNQVEDFYTNNSGIQTIDNFSTRIDFEMPYQWATLNYGGKISFTKDNAELDGKFYKLIAQNPEIYLAQHTIFDYTENNQALYFSAQKELGKKWEAKAGLRIESTQTKGFSEELNQTNKNNYTKLFPTAYLSYKPNDNHAFSLDYSRRIERPDYNSLNPAKWYQNLNSVIYGNPFLQPSFTNNFSLSHNYKSLSNLSLWLSLGQNASGQLTTHEEPDTVKMIRLNYFNFTNVGISESINFNFFNWWTNSSSITLSFNKTKINTEYLDPNYSGRQADCNTTNTFTLNKSKTLTGQLNYSYYFPSTFGESTTSNYSSLDVSCKYAMLKNKLNITVLLNNILNSDRAILQDVTQGVNQSFNQYYDTRLIRLSLSYKFGNSTISLETKEGGNEEEKKRSEK